MNYRQATYHSIHSSSSTQRYTSSIYYSSDGRSVMLSHRAWLISFIPICCQSFFVVHIDILQIWHSVQSSNNQLFTYTFSSLISFIGFLNLQSFTFRFSHLTERHYNDFLTTFSVLPLTHRLFLCLMFINDGL
jgi:hypothetical protein